jgi:vitamin K-dependent gamma-carboxylase
MKFSNKFFQQTDNSPLIIFRIAFGFLLCYQFLYALLSGSVYRDFIQPPFTFNYIGFDFLQPLPGNGMYYYVSLMVVLAIMIMIGAWYRISMIAFSLLWTALYLMQKSNYNNHYYLEILLCWIMVFMPANRYCSVDVKRKAVIETSTCSKYCIYVFIVQIAIVYFFAAISKLNADWFSGKYIAIQFSELSRRPKLGIIYGQHWFQLFICYAGFLFDLLIVPLLLWKKARNYAFIASCCFHLFNSFSFNIGTFPYLSIALNVFFFDGKKLRSLFFKKHTDDATNRQQIFLSFKQKIIIYCIGIYFLFQIIIPMRPWFYAGNVLWTEEGYRMSWKMMLRSKNGTVYFKVINTASRQLWIIDPAKKFSSEQVNWLAISPDIIWQYSQRIKNDFAKKSYNNIQVYAIGEVSLNRSKPTPLIDSTVNLAAIKWQPFKHSTWITKGP